MARYCWPVAVAAADEAGVEECRHPYYVVMSTSVWIVKDLGRFFTYREDFLKLALVINATGTTLQAVGSDGMFTNDYLETLRACTSAVSLSAFKLVPADEEGTTLLAEKVLWHKQSCPKDHEGAMQELQVKTKIGESGWEVDFNRCAAACAELSTCQAVEYPESTGSCGLKARPACSVTSALFKRFLMVKATLKGVKDVRCEGKWVPPPTTTTITSTTTMTTTSTSTFTTTLAWFRVRWQRSGRRSEHLLGGWNLTFELSREAPALRPGEEVELLPRSKLTGWHQQGESSIEDCETWDTCNGGQPGRLLESPWKADTTRIRWYDGQLSTSPSSAVIDACWSTRKAAELRAGDQVTPLPESEAAADVASGERGRVTHVYPEGIMTVAWYSSGLFMNYSYNMWWDKFLLSAKCDELAPKLGELVQVYPGAHFPPGALTGGTLPAGGDFGWVSSRREDAFGVTWNKTGQQSQWPSSCSKDSTKCNYFKFFRTVAEVSPLLLGTVLRAYGESRGVYAKGEKGSVVRLNGEELEVRWHDSGKRQNMSFSEANGESWLQKFDYVSEAHSLKIGDELSLFPELEGMTLKRRAGQITDLTGELLSVVLYDHGNIIRVKQGLWFSKFVWASEAVPLENGMQVAALPGNAYVNSCGEGGCHGYQPNEMGRIFMNVQEAIVTFTILGESSPDGVSITSPSWDEALELDSRTQRVPDAFGGFETEWVWTGSRTVARSTLPILYQVHLEHDGYRTELKDFDMHKSGGEKYFMLKDVSGSKGQVQVKFSNWAPAKDKFSITWEGSGETSIVDVRGWQKKYRVSEKEVIEPQVGDEVSTFPDTTAVVKLDVSGGLIGFQGKGQIFAASDNELSVHWFGNGSQSGVQSQIPRLTWFLHIRWLSRGRVLKLGDELGVIHGRGCGTVVEGEGKECEPDDRGRVTALKPLRIKWYSNITTELRDGDWFEHLWFSQEGHDLALGDMVRLISSFAFAKGSLDEQLAKANAVGCVYHLEPEVVHVVSQNSGRHYQLKRASWYDTVQTLSEALRFNFSDEVEVLPGAGFTSFPQFVPASGEVAVKAGAKGRVCQRHEVPTVYYVAFINSTGSVITDHIVEKKPASDTLYASHVESSDCIVQVEVAGSGSQQELHSNCSSSRKNDLMVAITTDYGETFKASICVAWYGSGSVVPVLSPYMRLKRNPAGRRLSNGVEVQVHGPLLHQAAGDGAGTTAPCALREKGRTRVLEDRVEVTCYSAKRSSFPRESWPEAFEIIDEAVKLELGLELERLPDLAGNLGPEAMDGGRLAKGRITSVSEDVIHVLLYTGSIVTVKRADWFATFRKSDERHGVVEGEELEALPLKATTGGCPGADRHGKRGRIISVEEAMLRLAWYEGDEDEAQYLAEEWFRCFMWTDQVHKLRALEEVSALRPAAWPDAGNSWQPGELPLEHGELGRVVTIEGGQVRVAWYRGAETSLDADKWTQTLRFADQAQTLHKVCELSVRPTRRERGGAPKLLGRIVKLDEAEMTVMWYSGNSTRNSTADWPLHFVFEHQAIHLKKGYELKLLPNRDCVRGAGDEDRCTPVPAGAQGRLIDVSGISPELRKFTTIWYNDGVTFLGIEATPSYSWAYDFLLTSDEEPAFEAGIELQVLPHENHFDGKCNPYYKEGWVGRLVSFDGSTKQCCARWYDWTNETCFRKDNWMTSFRYLGKAHALRLGDELQLLKGEACPTEAPGGPEAPEAPEVPEAPSSQQPVAFDVWPSARFLDVLEGRRLEARAPDGGGDGTSCEQGKGAVVLKYENSLHRGRVTKIDTENQTFCVTWYIGPTSCEPFEKTSWTKRYQLTNEAVELKAQAVVEVLNNPAARDQWPDKVGHWAVVSSVDELGEDGESSEGQAKSKLCLRFASDGDQGQCQAAPVGRWETSLRYVSAQQSEAQVAGVLRGHVVRARLGQGDFIRKLVKDGDEGVITWADATRFCTTWYKKRCCSCHDTAELKNLSFIVLRREAQAKLTQNLCKEDGEDSEVCVDGEYDAQEAPSIWRMMLVVGGVVGALLLVVAGLAARWHQQRKEEAERKAEQARMDLELANLKPPEVFISGISLAVPVSGDGSDSDGTMVFGSSMVELQESMNKISIPVSSKSKFSKDMVHCLKSGKADLAASGLQDFLGIPNASMGELHHDALEALTVEWNVFIDELHEHEDQQDLPEDERQAKKMMDLLEYILYKPAQEVEELSNDGHSTVVRDRGNQGLMLSDFHLKEQSTKANLSVAQVAALRIYTSELFKYINPPFRDPKNNAGFKEPHPTGLTVMLISEGLKKLRKLNGGDNSTIKIEFWRGMKNLEIPEEFEKGGGTELQCMSTTESQDIAAAYAKSDTPLIFCIQSDTFMNRGTDISWLSLYPHEKEILYPPLTYLQFIAKKKIQDSDGYVVYVRPTMN